MRALRTIGILLIIFSAILVASAYYFNHYWVTRYDDLIKSQAVIYKLDEKLVWSIVYQETYFRPWMIGADGEVGLMQVTPTVAKMWAKESGLKELEKQANENVVGLLSDPKRNIQAGCWYLEYVRAEYRGSPAETAMALAAYNAGPSRVDEWTRDADLMKLSEEEFVARIGIESTRQYVASILARYKESK